MIWNPFRWLRKSRRHTDRIRGARRRPLFRQIFPGVELLERRELFSVSFGAPSRPVTLERFTGGVHERTWFTPGTGGLSRLSIYDTASISITGSFALSKQGSYTLDLVVAGSGPSSTFTLSETGSASFTWIATGTFTNGTYTIASATLDQTVTVSYVFHEWDLNGVLLRVQSDTETFTHHETRTNLPDAFEWHGFGWHGLTMHLSDLEFLNLGAYSWDTFTADQDGFYTFTYHEDGSKTLGGSGTCTPTQRPGFSGTETYSYSGNATFILDQSGSGTYSLFEQGSYANGSFNLSSSVYDARSGETFLYRESGHRMVAGDGVHGASQSYSETSGTAYRSTDTLTLNGNGSYHFDGSATYTYREEGGSNSTWHEAGNYAGGSYNLNSHVYDRTGNGSFVYTETTRLSSNGTMVSTGSAVNSNGGTLTLGGTAIVGSGSFTNSSTETRTYSSSSNSTYTASGTGTFHLHQEGNYANASWALSSVLYDLGGTNSFDYQESGLQTWSGSGSKSFGGGDASTDTSSYGGTTRAGSTDGLTSGWETYSFGGNSNHQYERHGTGTFQLHQEGTFGQDYYSLSSHNYHSDGQNTFSYREQGLQTWSGNGYVNRTQDGAGNGTTSLGATSGNGQGTYTFRNPVTYSFNGQDSHTYNQRGQNTYVLDKLGRYAPNRWSLDTIVYRDTGSSTFSYDAEGERRGGGTGEVWISSTGGGAATSSFEGAVDGGLGTSTMNSATTYNYYGTLTFDSHLNGGSSYVLYREGSYADYSLNLDCATYDETGNSTSSYHETLVRTENRRNLTTSVSQGSSSSTPSGGGTTSSSFRTDSTVSSVYDGVSTSNYDADGTNSYHLYEEGTYSDGRWNLGSYAWQNQSLLTQEFHQTGRGHEVRNTTTRSFGSSTSGDKSTSFDDTSLYIHDGTVTFDHRQDGTGSFTTNASGTYSNWQYNYESVTYRAEGQLSSTYTEHGDGWVEGTVTKFSSESEPNRSASSRGTFNYDGTLWYDTTKQGEHTYTLYQNGRYAGGSWSLNSTAYRERGNSTHQLHEEANGHLKGSTANALHSVTASSNGNITIDETGTEGRESWTTYALDRQNSGSYVLYREGTVSQNNLSLTSSSFSLETSTWNQYYWEDQHSLVSTTSNVTTTSSAGVATQSTTSDSDVTTTYDAQTLGTASLYTKGGMSDQCWDLESVNYNSESRQSFTSHREAEGTISEEYSDGNGTSGSSYSEEWLDSTSRGLGTYTWLRQGTYSSGGGYSYSTYNYDAKTSGNGTIHVEGANEWSKSSSSGVTNGSDSFVEDSRQTSTFDQSWRGSFSGGTLTWSSRTVDSYQESTLTFHAQGNEHGNGMGWSNNSTYVYDQQDQSTDRLHYEGRFANNSWAFDSYCADATEASVGTYHEDGDEWTNLEGQIWGPNGPEGSGPSSNRWRTYRKDETATYSNSQHKTGTFANNSFSYSSYVLNESTVNNYSAHEQGTWTSNPGSNGTWIQDDVSNTTQTVSEVGVASLGTRTLDGSTYTYHMLDATINGSEHYHEETSDTTTGHAVETFVLPGSGLEGYALPNGIGGGGMLLALNAADGEATINNYRSRLDKSLEKEALEAINADTVEGRSAWRAHHLYNVGSHHNGEILAKRLKDELGLNVHERVVYVPESIHPLITTEQMDWWRKKADAKYGGSLKKAFEEVDLKVYLKEADKINKRYKDYFVHPGGTLKDVNVVRKNLGLKELKNPRARLPKADSVNGPIARGTAIKTFLGVFGIVLAAGKLEAAGPQIDIFYMRLGGARREMVEIRRVRPQTIEHLYNATSEMLNALDVDERTKKAVWEAFLFLEHES